MDSDYDTACTDGALTNLADAYSAVCAIAKHSHDTRIKSLAQTAAIGIEVSFNRCAQYGNGRTVADLREQMAKQRNGVFDKAAG